MDDLAQLEKILFRFATSDTDESLEKTLAKHLAPSLFKLSSQDEAVRKKCMELLVHVNKRVKNNDNIQLPMEGLLEQYRNPNSTSFIINFTIIYIKMGFPRLPLERKVEHIPKLLRCLEDKPASHQESILVMILPFLEHLKCSSENPESKSNYLNLPKTVSKLFCDFIFDFLLLPYGSHPSIKPADPNDKIQVPPGLSEAAWKKVAGETLMKPEELEKVKTNVVKFLGNGLISEKEIAMHLVIAMADTRHSVSTEADSVMRRFSGGIDWNDKVHKLSVFSITNIITTSFYLFYFVFQDLVNQLYDVFLGTLVIKGKDGKLATTTSGATGVVHIKPENKRTPSSTRLRLKLMPYLVRSKEAALSFPASIQVIFDLLFGTGGNSNAKLKVSNIFSLRFNLNLTFFYLDSCGDLYSCRCGTLSRTKDYILWRGPFIGFEQIGIWWHFIKEQRDC